MRFRQLRMVNLCMWKSETYRTSVLIKGEVSQVHWTWMHNFEASRHKQLSASVETNTGVIVELVSLVYIHNQWQVEVWTEGSIEIISFQAEINFFNTSKISPKTQNLWQIGFYHSGCGSEWTPTGNPAGPLRSPRPLCCIKDDLTGRYLQVRCRGKPKPIYSCTEIE